MWRKIIGAAIGVTLLIVAVDVAKTLIDNNTRPTFEVPKQIKTVFTKPVINGEIPIIVNANGNLVASRKVEIFAEVQGIFNETNKPFKSGESYRKGETLMDIESREFYTSLLAQRSTLYDQITGMMPDLRFDYPESFNHWQEYLRQFDLQENLKPLPEPINEKEKYFVNGRQIVTTYYNIKNLEERYRKYHLEAPFDGILTEATVNPGTLIRSGQKLGEFVSTSDYELEVDVNQEYINILKIGKAVKLTDLEGENEWIGTVRRVNGRLDQATQTVKVFIGVQGAGLIEGMYLEAKIAAESKKDAIEIPRNLLVNENELFAVNDGKLVVMQVNPVYFTDETAIIKGLPDGTQILSRPLPGAYEGMLVKVTPTTGNIEN